MYRAVSKFNCFWQQ